MRELRPVSYDYGPSGFSYDDDIVVSKTEGSEFFEPQTRQPQTAQPTRYSAIQDYEDEGIISRAELYRQKRAEEEERRQRESFQSPFKDSLAKEENFAEDDSEPIDKDFGLLTQASDDEAEAEQSTPQNLPIRVKEKKKIKPTFIQEKEETEDQDPQQNEEDVKPMNFPKVAVPKHDNYPFSPEKIPYAKSKPTAGELAQWKE